MNTDYISIIPWIVGIPYVVISAVGGCVMLYETIKNPTNRDGEEPNKSSKPKSLDCLVK
mgnify:CR=1 FL=1